MATTAHGYPYPLGTDRVMDGDDVIHSLADKVDTNLGYGMFSGQVSLTINALNTPVSVAVTFPVGRFTVAPNVAVGLNTGAPNTNMGSMSGTSATGVTIWAVRTGGTVPVSQVVYYVAHSL